MFGVVSRRSRHRAGTRYFSRGIDEHGHVSNFNETEQILVLDRTKEAASAIRGEIRASYVQIRGSVPIYWAEVNNLRYKPDLVIMDLAKTVRLLLRMCGVVSTEIHPYTLQTDSLRRHFDSILPLYGDLLLVNLVNQKGYEKPVKEALEKAITALGDPQVRYTYFDFHHECKGPRFDRVSLLLDRLSDDLQQQGFVQLLIAVTARTVTDLPFSDTSFMTCLLHRLGRRWFRSLSSDRTVWTREFLILS